MDYLISSATIEDAATIAHLRALMFNDQGGFEPVQLAEMEVRYTEWVADNLRSGDYWGWFAKSLQGELVGSAGLWLREWPPILKDYTGRQGYIENVYVMPAFRRKGVARQLMLTLLDWARSSGKIYNIELHATTMAHELYQSLGFESDDGRMGLWIGPIHVQ